MKRRLFITSPRSVTVAQSWQVAQSRLGPDVRPATSEELRLVLTSTSTRLSTTAICQLLGVSRQALHDWRKRLGLHQTSYAAHKLATRRLVSAQLRAGDPVRLIAQRLGCGESTVYRIARAEGILTTERGSYPEDSTLVELAKGKTWPEFAVAVGRTIRAIRSYVHARPQLAREVRAVLVLRAPGRKPKHAQ